MKASELLARIQELIAVHGDVGVFVGDCVPMQPEHFNVYEPVTECPKERALLGDKYLEVGNWW
jgi:hypothetical protein